MRDCHKEAVAKLLSSEEEEPADAYYGLHSLSVNQAKELRDAVAVLAHERDACRVMLTAMVEALTALELCLDESLNLEAMCHGGGVDVAKLRTDYRALLKQGSAAAKGCGTEARKILGFVNATEGR